MSKVKSLYFEHDFDAMSDEKIRAVRRQYGMLGYGVYFGLLELLAKNGGALACNYADIAYDMHVEESVIKSIIEDFMLFTVEQDGDCCTFRSDRLSGHLERMDGIRESRSMAGKASAARRASISMQKPGKSSTHVEHMLNTCSTHVQQNPTNAEQNPTHIDIDIDKDLDIEHCNHIDCFKEQKNIITPTTTNAREEKKEAEDEVDYFDMIAKDDVFITNMAISCSIGADEIIQLIPKFKAHCITIAKEHESQSECRKHFTNWVNRMKNVDSGYGEPTVRKTTSSPNLGANEFIDKDGKRRYRLETTGRIASRVVPMNAPPRPPRTTYSPPTNDWILLTDV